MTYFLTSDTHFHHRNVISYCNRPFKSVEEMNEKMIERWNDRVTDKDTVFHLGDFGLGNKKNLSPIAARLKGNKVLLKGNHDNLTLTAYRMMGFICPNFKDISPQIVIQGDETLYRCCHYPYADPLFKEERYLDRRPVRPAKDDIVPYCDILICGHVHEKWKFKDHMVNVGVDQWDFAPVSIDELENYLVRKYVDDRRF